MFRPLRRNRKFFASAALGVWVFALFVGIANACSWDGVTAVPHQQTTAAHAVGDAMDDGMAPGCEQFCSNDIPLLSALQLIQDQPAGQPLLVASISIIQSPTAAAAVIVVHIAHPPPDVPVLLRSHRLAL